MRDLLKKGAAALSISLSDDTVDKYVKYYEKVVKYNKNVNLTAISDEREFVIKHFLDSLTAEKYLQNDISVCDIGAGAGFPSVPLRLYREDLSFTMLDALNKRVNFLESVISEFGLTNCFAVHARAEEAGRQKYRDRFDAVVARAVADIKVLSEYAVPLLKTGGRFIAYKGSDLIEMEGISRVLNKLNAKLIDVVNLRLPLSGDERNLIIIEKCGDTPFIFPRHYSKIIKNPL
jgi:16S rRNA (guanine(527)-N(7))-methyltransferase GidB